MVLNRVLGDGICWVRVREEANHRQESPAVRRAGWLMT